MGDSIFINIITLLIGFGTFYFLLKNDMQKNLEGFKKTTSENFGKIDTRLDKIDTRLDKIDTRLDKIDTRLDKISDKQ